ncbi:unnamed protein product [Peronospora farinosa]|uniref:Uncharacterized protein n=1 Tax=Peronospora farinosa TaxID=134698 RepID=A0AAV0THM9_9STRA|nr:unnamed protein product [Peronospora farinosa]
MLRNARSLGVNVAALTSLTGLAVGEVAQQYHDRNTGFYAKQRLQQWRDTFESEKTSDESDSKPTGASAWLGNAPPKFPYLLSISAGDDPVIVTNKLLGGAKVLGSYEERTCDTLKRLTAPTSALGRAAHRIAIRYAALKSYFRGNLPVDFHPRGGVKAEAEGVMMDALLVALRDLQHCDQQSKDYNDENDVNASANPQTSQATVHLVFFLRDFNLLNDRDAERWLCWTHQVSSEGLAHVVLSTTATVTPSKAQWLRTRHQIGLSTAALDDTQNFVGILLRPANGLVDDTSAEEKLREIAKSYNLRLDLHPALTASVDSQGDINTTDSKHDAEIEAIVKTTGNWWSDIDMICRRLKENNANAVTLPEERLAMIHKVCNDFVQDIEVVLLASLHLDGSLQLPYKIATSDTFKASGSKDSEALPQQLLGPKDKAPRDCVSPVNALLPFHYRKDGEQKFLDLIDQQLLFLRPKDVVEIGVIPCKTAALVSTCWVQIRPVVKKAFEKIHKSDTYFRAMLDIDRFAANIEMQKEIEQYEQEIAERREALFGMKRDFTILQFSMTLAEKANRKAELALIDVELQAKDVYLEKLRSLQPW